MKSESINKNIPRHFSPFVYAFSPQNIKDVCVDMVTKYETTNIMTIKSYPIAITFRFIQLFIIAYIVGYVIWYRGSYQDHDLSMVSSVIIKVKGIGSYGKDPSIILDNTDYVIPPQEINALFIMTSFITTDQKRSRCAEAMTVRDALCANHSQCQPELQNHTESNGRWTGQCRMPEGRCEIEGWCPVEDDIDMPPPIMNSINYTVLLNNFIEFTRFGVKRTNVFNESTYFRQCLYDPRDNKYCPIFRLGDILDVVESDDEERYKMLQHGAVVRIKIDWMCNLDLGEDQCRPHYSFGRLDSRFADEQFSFGFNFRYVSYWKIRYKSHRTLKKVFGLRLVVTVNGDAGRFDLFVLTLNIGSMIGVLGLATVICDIVALYFSEQGYIYRRQKFQSVYLKRTSSAPTIVADYRRKVAKRKIRIKESIENPSEEPEC